MAITFEGSGHTSIATAATAGWGFTPAAGTLPGDVYVVQVYAQDASATITPPAAAEVLHNGPVGTPSAGDRVAIFIWQATSASVTPVSVGVSPAAQGVVSWVRFRGVDPADPSDAFELAALVTGDNAPAAVAPSITTTGPNRYVLSGWNGDAGGAIESLAAPAGHTVANGTILPRKGAFALKGIQAAAGATGATGPWTALPDNAWAGPRRLWQLALTPLASTEPDPDPEPAAAVLDRTIQGIPTATGHQVSTRTTGATRVRLLAGVTAASLPTVGAWATVDAAGWAKPSVTGLTADTAHYFRVEMDNGSATSLGAVVGPIRTAPQPMTPTTFSFVIGGDNHTTDGQATAYSHIIARNPRFFLSTGDTHSGDNSNTTQASHRADWENLLTNYSGFRDAVARVPFAQTYGDHDAGGGNNGIPGAWTAPNIAAYRQVIPHPESPLLPSNTAWSFGWGRVRVIGLDNYHERTAAAKLSAAQMTWLEQELNKPEPLKVILVSAVWYDDEPPEGWPDGDGWADYPAQRTAIVGLINASKAAGNTREVLAVHGDQHALAAMNGAGNEHGGFPVVGASPLSGWSSHKGSAPNGGRWPSTEDQLVHQHGVVTVTDNGTQISVGFRGYDDSNTARVSLDFTVPTAPQAPVIGIGSLTDPAGRWVKDPVRPLWYDGQWRAILPSNQGHVRATLSPSGGIVAGEVVDARQGARVNAVHGGGKTYLLRQHPTGCLLNVYSSTWAVVRQNVAVPLSPVDADQSPVDLLRASNGHLWAGAVYGGAVRVVRSTDDGATWSPMTWTPWANTVTGAVKLLESDGNVVVVASGNDGAGREARRLPLAATSITTGWATEQLPSLGSAKSDDHISGDVLPDGRAILALKTSDAVGTEPLLYSLIRTPAGVWSMQTIEVGPGDRGGLTRPRVLVLRDRVEVYYGAFEEPTNLYRRQSSLTALGQWSAPSTVLTGADYSSVLVAPRRADIATDNMDVPLVVPNRTANTLSALWRTAGVLAVAPVDPDPTDPTDPVIPGVLVKMRLGGQVLTVRLVATEDGEPFVRAAVRQGGATVPIVQPSP